MMRMLLFLGLGLGVAVSAEAAPKAVRYVDCREGWDGCCDENAWEGCPSDPTCCEIAVGGACLPCSCDRPANDGFTPETPMRSLQRAVATAPVGAALEIRVSSQGQGYCTGGAAVVEMPPDTVLLGSEGPQGAALSGNLRFTGGASRMQDLYVSGGAVVASGGSLAIDGCVLNGGLVATDTKLDLRRSLFPSEGAVIQASYGDPGAAKDPFHMEDCQSWYGDLRVTCDGVACGPVTIERSYFVQIHAGGFLDAVNGGRMLVKLRDAVWAQDIFVHGDVRFIGK